MKKISLKTFLLPIRICKYRNCNKEVIGKRVDAVFCSKQCKDCEKIYRKREKERNNI